jgi:hypothetical protein
LAGDDERSSACADAVPAPASMLASTTTTPAISIAARSLSDRVERATGMSIVTQPASPGVAPASVAGAAAVYAARLWRER